MLGLFSKSLLLWCFLFFSDGFRGSGIYHGKDGYITYTYGATNASQLLIADVPLDNVTVSFSKNRTELPVEYDGIIYDDLSNYTFVELSDHSSGMTLLSTGNLSCAVWYKFEDSITDGSYFLAGYDGYITLGDGEYYLAVQTCAVMWCRNASFSQCVHPPVTSEIYLVNLTLEGNFSTSYIYPSSLQHDLLPINTNVWKFEQMSLPEVIGDSSVITSARIITQNGFHYRPAVIGLYGRLYDLDTS